VNFGKTRVYMVLEGREEKFYTAYGYRRKVHKQGSR